MEKGTSISTQRPKECWNDLFSSLHVPMRGVIANLIGKNYEHLLGQIFKCVAWVLKVKVSYGSLLASWRYMLKFGERVGRRGCGMNERTVGFPVYIFIDVPF